MGLRTKFILALGTIVAVLVGVTLFSLLSTSRTQKRLSGLTDVTIAELESGRFLGETFEIEGDWSRNGVFVAREIEPLPHPRRPKLRAELQDVDVDEGRIQMLGRSIRIDGDTEFDWEGSLHLDRLTSGQRLEISCEVLDDGTWRARKIRSEGLKSSDKIKGTVTAIHMDGVLPDTLEISGFPILLTAEEAPRDPRMRLREVSLATRMNLLSQDCFQAVHRTLDDPDATMLTREGDFVRADEFLVESIQDLESTLDLIRSDRPTDTTAELEYDLWIDRIQERIEKLAHHATTLLSLQASDPERARAYQESTFDPFVLEDLQQALHGYLLYVEESVVEEASQIAEQSSRMTRVLLITSGLAILIAVLMAASLWRSVSRPLGTLQSAARSIGEGKFETKVQLDTGDEFADLGRSMNEMAAHLASTTVSLTNLNDIFDSMASALFVADSEYRIRGANTAALRLLGLRNLSEIQGTDFSELVEDSSTTHGERRLRRADGRLVTVVIAEAELRGGGFVFAAQDLTERLAMEEQLRVSLKEKDLLLREVHHRVKNNLQVISSLLALQSTQIADADTRAVFADCQSRIRSMALIHQQLYSSTDVAAIDLASYLDQLASALYRSQSSTTTRIELDTQLGSVPISLDQALACGLILNELVTNSIKHAFDGRESGTIRIQTGIGAEGHARLVVGDDGKGMDPDAAAQSTKGLGMRLVRALVDQLGGSLETANVDGLSYRIEFPLDQVTAA